MKGGLEMSKDPVYEEQSLKTVEGRRRARLDDVSLIMNSNMVTLERTVVTGHSDSIVSVYSITLLLMNRSTSAEGQTSAWIRDRADNEGILRKKPMKTTSYSRVITGGSKWRVLVWIRPLSN